MLSPPSSRCSPTAVRVKPIFLPPRVADFCTEMSVKSVVPPPMSQTKIWSPASTSSVSRACCDSQ
jgi:hypothetical protein